MFQNRPINLQSSTELARLVDYTNLSAAATSRDIRKLCNEAMTYGFYSVCVNPSRTYEAKQCLKGSKVNVVAVVSFPFGASKPQTKAIEADSAIKDGATEIDMVANLGRLCEGDYSFVAKEILLVSKVSRIAGTPLKVIIETGLLRREQIIRASQTVQKAGADYVKTCTGYGPRGVTVQDVKTIRYALGDRTGIKASGGIRAASTVLKLLRAGANRIGTSRGPEIMKSFRFRSGDK